MLEEFTGAWCGFCTRGAEIADHQDSIHHGKFIPVAIHYNDVMEIAQGVFVDSVWNDIGYPGGMINRVASGTSATMSTNQWSSKTTAILAQTATAGLAIDASSITGEVLNLKVKASINSTVTGPYRLNVYLLEKSVINSSSQYNQQNYLSQSGSSPDASSYYYHQPRVINNFNHKHVLRKVISSYGYGDPIPVDKVGGGKEYIATYAVNLTGYTQNKMTVVAFIDAYDAHKLKHKVLNVQKTDVGTNKNYD